MSAILHKPRLRIADVNYTRFPPAAHFLLLLLPQADSNTLGHVDARAHCFSPMQAEFQENWLSAILPAVDYRRHDK